MTGSSTGSDVGQSTAPSEAASLEVFISYRREDAAANAGRLADALVARFGRESVFMDVDTIEPGADYTEVIDKAVGHCDVLIALIGPHWLDAANARGRRLDDPQDLVRLEIESALARNIRVIPALVSGAAMPAAEELPGSLASLAKRNALELSHSRFQADLQLLLKPLEKIAQQKGGTAATVPHSPVATPIAPPKPAPRSGPLPSLLTARPSRLAVLAGAIVALLIIGSAGVLVVNRNKAGNAASKTANVLAVPNGYVGTWKGSGHSFNPSVDFAITMTIRAGQLGQVVGDIDRPTLGCKLELVLDKASGQSITLTEQGGGYCASAGQGVASVGYKILASLSGTSLSWKEFPKDSSSSNATASATLAQATSGAVPGTSSLLAVPDSYVGTWKGSGHSFSPSVDFAIIMTIRAGQLGQVVGAIDRPTLGCKLELVLDKATTKSVTLTEQGGGYCASAGQVVASVGNKILASLSGTSLDWKEFQTDPSSSSATSTATLAQGTSGPVPGTSTLLAVPDSYIGTWKGSGHSFNPSVDFAITMTIRAGQLGQVVGEINRPTLGCKLELVLDKATTQSLILTEQGGGYCATAGQVVASVGNKILASLSGSSLDWKEFQTDPSSSSATSTATLGLS